MSWSRRTSNDELAEVRHRLTVDRLATFELATTTASVRVLRVVDVTGSPAWRVDQQPSPRRRRRRRPAEASVVFGGRTAFDRATIRFTVDENAVVRAHLDRRWTADPPLELDGTGGRVEFSGDDEFVRLELLRLDQGWTSTPIEITGGRGHHVRGAACERGEDRWTVQMSGFDGEARNHIEETAAWTISI